jgi:hypothetical protein
MDPSNNEPYRYLTAPPTPEPFTPPPAPELAAEAAIEAAPLTIGEILPPVTEAAVPQYPIGLIDFNLPIVVVDAADYNDEEYDNASIVTVLKGSLNPVVISFWKHGEQCIAQFDTDGNSSCGDYRVEQDHVYPRTVYVVIGRDGRNLEVDDEFYGTEEAARAETSLDDIAGIFPLVIEAPAPTIAQDVTGTDHLYDNELKIEENKDYVDVAVTEGTPDEAPTRRYVAGRMRRVGETVHAVRNRSGLGVRVCTITKMRNNASKSLCLQPSDGSPAYWAWNKNVRY